MCACVCLASALDCLLGGGTSLLLRGTGLFWRDVGGTEEERGVTTGSGVAGRGVSSVRSMRGGVWPAGKPSTGVRTSGTTSASGGILGSDSLRGPPQAEHDMATGVLCSVHRGHAQPPLTSPTSPLEITSIRLTGSSTNPAGGSPGLGVAGESWGGAAAVATAALGGAWGRASWGPLGAAPHTEQEPAACGLVSVQRPQTQRGSSALSRRMWLRSGFCRGASQMEQRGDPPAFRKVQRPHDHSPPLPRTTAAMEPGE